MPDLTVVLLQTYNQIYNTTMDPRVGGSSALNYTSPLLHSVVVANLTPGVTYFYRVGDGTTFSGIFNFTSLPAPGKKLKNKCNTIPTKSVKICIRAMAG